MWLTRTMIRSVYSELTAYSNMSVTPRTIDFGRQHGLSSESQLITVSNTGRAVLTFSAYANEPWIVIDNGTGPLGANEEGSFSVSVNVADMPVGSYKGEVTVSSQQEKRKKSPLQLLWRGPGMI